VSNISLKKRLKGNIFLLRKTIIMDVQKVNLAQKLSTFSDYFNPKIVGELNGQHVKLVKFAGEFVWHHHDNEDELFYVVKGNFDMHLSDKIITINAGEFLIIPKGVEHKPVAKEEVEIMLFEPATTLNTGNTKNELTKDFLEKI
jgi:mannose-6-phosphate isomerase-like protein (cupin superfamily)